MLPKTRPFNKSILRNEEKDSVKLDKNTMNL